MQYTSELKLTNFSKEKCHQYIPRQLKHFAENPEFSESIQEYLNTLFYSYREFGRFARYSSYSGAKLQKSDEEIKRDLLLSLTFQNYAALANILHAKPELCDVILTVEQFTFTNSLSNEQFSAMCHLKLPHFIALLGSYPAYDCVSMFFRNQNKTDIDRRKYFSQPLKWNTNTLQGTSGPTPFFIAVLNGKQKLTSEFGHWFQDYDLIPEQGFDMAFLNAINPYQLVLQQDEFEDHGETHAFSSLASTVKTDAHMRFLREALQYAVDEALAGNTLFLERYINADHVNNPYFSTFLAGQDNSQLKRVIQRGNLDVLKIMTTYLSRTQDGQAELCFAIGIAKNVYPEIYLPIIKHLLKCLFVSQNTKNTIQDLVDPSLLSTLFIKRDDTWNKLSNILKVAVWVQDAIVQVTPSCRWNISVTSSQNNVDPIALLQKAAALDSDFFNELIRSHLHSDNGRLNHYLYAFLLNDGNRNIRHYLGLLFDLCQKSPQLFHSETLCLIADEIRFYVGDSLREVISDQYNFATEFYHLLRDNSEPGSLVYNHVEQQLAAHSQLIVDMSEDSDTELSRS